MAAPEAAPDQPKQRKHKRAKFDKGKQKELLPAVSGYTLHRVGINIPLAPVFANDIRRGVMEVLDHFVTHFVPCLGFVLVTYNAETLAIDPFIDLIDPTAMMLVRVTFEGLGWRPSIGSRIKARLAHSVQSHVSLIVHNTFNASIAADHLPKDRYRYDPDQEDPHSMLNANLPVDDFYADQWKEADDAQRRYRGSGASTGVEGGIQDLELASSETEAEVAPQTVATDNGHLGCWIDTETKLPIGDAKGYLTFTVIGLTMANQVLSLHGSLLDDPFVVTTSSGMPKLPHSPELQHNLREDNMSHRMAQNSVEAVTVETGDDVLDPDSNFAVDHGRSGVANSAATVGKKRKKKQKANETAGDASVTIPSMQSAAEERPKKKRKKPKPET